MSKGDGKYIVIEFSKPLIGDVSGNESYFQVSVPMYEYVPGGTLSDVVVPVISTAAYPDNPNAVLLEFGAGNVNSIQNAAGPITISYAGGTLQGNGGPVEAFSETFTAIDLDYKGGQNDAEHLELSNITATGVLTRIYYGDYQAGGEHLEISAITASGTLTHINNI